MFLSHILGIGFLENAGETQLVSITILGYLVNLIFKVIEEDNTTNKLFDVVLLLLSQWKSLKKLRYYNNVPSLQELYRLRFNQRLQELDLRLNPVARNEPDYRLFLIHMLPNLRRLGK